MNLKFAYSENDGTWIVSNEDLKETEKPCLYVSEADVGIIAHMLICWHRASPQDRPYPDLSPKAEKLLLEHDMQQGPKIEFQATEYDDPASWGIMHDPENLHETPIAFFDPEGCLDLVEDILKAYNSGFHECMTAIRSDNGWLCTECKEPVCA